ncbi:hypothetical protein GGR38_004695 [Novosphingobium sediminicola]|uniref:Uncharacterized protein n=1 Tax=Novosphingobium sediminicola TaxID=563162 RepID=A0A7W6CLL5_9SPHN|nr:hypothetical protein [Novosphingobium sediminicola]
MTGKETSVREVPLDALAINAVFEIGTLTFPTASCDGQASTTDKSMIPKPIYLAPKHPMTEAVHLISAAELPPERVLLQICVANEQRN